MCEREECDKAKRLSPEEFAADRFRGGGAAHYLSVGQILISSITRC